MDPKLAEALKRFLHYSFEEIDYEYKNLTPQEKQLFSKQEFDQLIIWLLADVVEVEAKVDSPA